MLSTVKIKICGITNAGDAQCAAECGADALGFIFHERSPRHMTFAAVREITRGLPPFVAKVGVFVNAPEALIRRAVDEAGLDTLQLHGDEPPDFCAQFALPVVKAFRVKDASTLASLQAYRVSAWLLDSYVAGAEGGTGEKFNWDLACEARTPGSRIILAGGLTPANIAEAIQKVRPYAVDVSSGVEAEPRKKDAEKMRGFIGNARRAMERR